MSYLTESPDPIKTSSIYLYGKSLYVKKRENIKIAKFLVKTLNYKNEVLHNS